MPFKNGHCSEKFSDTSVTSLLANEPHKEYVKVETNKPSELFIKQVPHHMTKQVNVGTCLSVEF